MQNELTGDVCFSRYEELKREIAVVSSVARKAAARSPAEPAGANESRGRDRSQTGGANDPRVTVRSYLDIRMVAAIFAVHPKTIETWIRTAGFPCLRLGGVRRFDYDDVTRWASARKEG